MSTSAYKRFVKEHLVNLLASAGLDVQYERAEGSYLFRRGEDGREVAVLDLLGGYGALLFGHYHPELVAALEQAVARRTPIHAQLSRRETTGRLAERLANIVGRESAVGEGFVALFGNTGAEAVETALKHAESVRLRRIEMLRTELELAYAPVRTRLRQGEEQLAHGLNHPLVRNGEAGGAALMARIEAHNSAVLARPALFLSLLRAFHGKSVGTLQLTHGAMYRAPFGRLGVESRFVDPDDAGAIESLLRDAEATLLVPHWSGETIELEERPLSRVAAFFAEPIQGEGGVHCLSREQAARIRAICDRCGCPLVVDEIQSGLGRSGSFLASPGIGLKGDYFLLSKALGGGLVKLGVTLIRRGQFNEAFGVTHSNTFAEDDLSSEVALAVLNLLERDDGAAYRRIADLGERLRQGLEVLRERYPAVVREVRGRGLLLALELVDQQAAESMIIRGAAYTHALGYLLCGYLLQKENIRVAPTSSAPNVLRLEPSMLLTEAEIEHTLAALDRVCRLLAQSNAAPLVAAVADVETPPPASRAAVRPPRAPAAKGGAAAPVKVAFVNHLIDADWLTQVDPSLEGLEPEALRTFVHRMEPDKRGAPFDPVIIRSAVGPEVAFYLYPLCVTSEQMVGYLHSGRLDRIQSEVADRVRAARDDGCLVAGLGMYTSIVTNNCTTIAVPRIALTSGNALTIGMALEAVEETLRGQGRDLNSLTVAVVGATGNIATTYASLLAARAHRLLLVGSGRGDSLARLRRTAESVYADALTAAQAAAAPLAGIEQALAQSGWAQEMAGVPAKRRAGRLMEALQARHGEDPFIQLTTDLTLLPEADVVICAANADRAFIQPQHLKQGAVVCDIAVPANVVTAEIALRPDLTYMQGGIVATPDGASLPDTARAFLREGELFACMAETAVLGLSGRSDHFSYGPLSRDKVREIGGLARLHGFALAGMKTGSSL